MQIVEALAEIQKNHTKPQDIMLALKKASYIRYLQSSLHGMYNCGLRRRSRREQKAKGNLSIYSIDITGEDAQDSMPY